MALIYIGVGSNIEPQRHVPLGIQALAAEFSALRLSTVYESAAVGFNGANFYNLVAEAQTERSVEQVVATLKRLEFAHGRAVDARKFSSRTLDLDLLSYDQQVLDSPTVLPRAEILTSAFVLRPFSELNPDFWHPVVGMTLASLWQRYDAASQPLTAVQLDWASQTESESAQV